MDTLAHVANRSPLVRRRFGWLLLALLLVAVSLPIVDFARDRFIPPPEDHIPWRRDFAAALREAQATGRPVLMDVTASWCPPCRAMKRSTWPDPRVGALARDRFIPVLLDVDVPAEGLVAQQYGVPGYPTVVTLEPDGRLRDVAETFDADAIVEFLTRSAAMPTSTPATVPTTEP